MGQGYLSSKATAKHDRILADIASKGLYPSIESGRLRSSDHNVFNKIALNVVDFANARRFLTPGEPFANPASDKDKEDTFQYLVLSQGQGAWSILLERNFTIPFDDYHFEQRLQESVYFIFKLPDGLECEQPSHKINSNSSGDSITDAKYLYDNRYYSYEAHTQQTLEPKQLIAALVPRALADVVKRAFPELEIIAVDDMERGIRHLGLAEEERTPYLTGPDYVTGLQKVVKNHKLTHFGAHILRLPTETDMIHRYKDEISLTGMLAFYDTDDINHALRQAAARVAVDDIEYLVMKGAKVNVKDSGTRQRTALHWTLVRNHPVAARFLLQYGADSHLQDADGYSADSYAAKRGINLEKLRNHRALVERGYQEKAARAKKKTHLTPETFSSMGGASIIDTLTKLCMSAYKDALTGVLEKDPELLSEAQSKLLLNRLGGISHSYWLITSKNTGFNIDATIKELRAGNASTVSSGQQPQPGNVFDSAENAKKALKKRFDVTSVTKGGPRIGFIIQVLGKSDDLIRIFKDQEQFGPKLGFMHMLTFNRNTIEDGAGLLQNAFSSSISKATAGI